MAANAFADKLALEVQKLIGEKLGPSMPNEVIDGLAIICDDTAYRLGISTDVLLDKITASIKQKAQQDKANPLNFLKKLKEAISSKFDANITIECNPNEVEMYNNSILGINARILVALDKNSNNDSYTYFVTFNDCYDVKKFEIYSGWNHAEKECRFNLHKDATIKMLEVITSFFNDAHKNIRKLRYEDCENVLF